MTRTETYINFAVAVAALLITGVPATKMFYGIAIILLHHYYMMW